jgi:hypothetical protein
MELPEMLPIYMQMRQMMRCAPRLLRDAYGRSVTWGWSEAQVRRALQAPDDVRWFAALIHLAAREEATLCFFTPPLNDTWRDEALEDWAEVYLTLAGVWTLAAWYGRR